MTNISIPDTRKINYHHRLVDQASASVVRYDALVNSSVIDTNFLLSLLTLRESETTSRLEGTEITFEDMVLQDGYDRGIKKRSPAMEALGVRFAIDEGSKMVKEGMPISNRLIKAMHGVLMRYAQYDNKNIVPGDFRSVNVRVGRYKPPDHQLVLDLMSDLEKYIHDQQINIPSIVKVGIVHAQFERIHPFADGNGRIGRLLISFLLKEYGLTGDVVYFMSPYIEKNRENKDVYYEGLERIEYEGGWDKWVVSFLDMVIGASNDTNKRVEELIALYKDGNFLNFHSKHSQHIRNFIFSKPIFRISQLQKYLVSKDIDFSVSGIRSQLNNSKDVDIFLQSKGSGANVYRCASVVDTLIKD